jgi:hypothetical protein
LVTETSRPATAMVTGDSFFTARAQCSAALERIRLSS